MLNSINLNDKSYDQLMEEAISQIPLYSKEWTNFNASDPGVTILENLTAFHLLQRISINKISDDVRRAMLSMLGFSSSENKGAVLLIQSPKGQTGTLPAHMPLKVGTLQFETAQPTTLYDWSLKAVYTKQADQLRDVTYLMDPKVGSMAPFGTHPQEGNAFYLILEGNVPSDTPLSFWFKIEGEASRNPFPTVGGVEFAHLTWEYFTASGWKEAKTQDNTRNFLCSGEVTLILNQEDPILYTELPQEGCTIRCTLTESHYDSVPRIETLSVNLFPVVQKETRVWTSVHTGAEKIELNSLLAVKDFRYVYCMEEGAEGYFAYSPDFGQGGVGRFYRMEPGEEGNPQSSTLTLHFDKERYGFAPCEKEDAIRVVCYDEEMIHHRDLGVVYGYENQYISIDLVENLLSEECSLMVECPHANGGFQYHFVKPGETAPDKLCYTVDCSGGGIQIQSPGMGTEYRLYLADCVTTQGVKGNIASGKQLTFQENIEFPVSSFYSPSKGQGGVSWEDLEALRCRLNADIRQTKTAVTPEDYENLVLRTPGLALHKAKAMAVSEKNLIRLVAMPVSTKRHPLLSPEYVTQIKAFMEECRMLTTKVELLQPQYVPIHVAGCLVMETNHKNGQEEVNTILERWLNHIEGDGNFGAFIRFYDLHRLLMELPSVVAIEHLRISSGQGATTVGMDIQMDFNSICYLGNLEIEFLSVKERLKK